MKSRIVQTLAPRARIAQVLVAVALAGFFAASCDVHGISAPGTLASLTVSPNPTVLAINGTQQFTAFNRFGEAVAATWLVTGGGGAISTSGAFTAGTTTGQFNNTVQATSGGLTATATVFVNTGPLATITVSPNPQTLQAGSTQQFTAVGKDAAGNAVSITPVWSVAAGGGTIAATGIFTAGGTPGTFPNTVKATSGTISGTATVTVTPLLATITVTPNPASMPTNATQQFAATGRDASGNVVPITPVWSVVNGGGSIDPNSGLFTAGTVTGTFNNTVKATSGTISGTATVTVNSTGPNPAVNLGRAAPNGIMAGTAVTCAVGSAVLADVSISPGSTITGPCTISGAQHLNDQTAIDAQTDLTAAYNALVALPCGTVIGTANIGATTKTPGVYCSGSSIGVTGTLTLDGQGDPNALFVFQAGSSLTTAGNVVLIGGAQAKNVYWQVGSDATLGTASQWQGNILALGSITLVTDANLHGRALARTGAVVLGTNSQITLP